MLKKLFATPAQRTTLSVAVATLLLSSASVAQADSNPYTYTPAYSAPLTNSWDQTTSQNAQFTGINDSGTTVGSFNLYNPADGRYNTVNGDRLRNGYTYGFVGNDLFNPRSSNAALNLGSANNVTGINNSGQVVGTYYAGNTQTAFIANGNAATSTSYAASVTAIQDTASGAQTTAANGINNNGLVVGTNSFESGINDGFVYNSSNSTVAGIAGNSYAEINAAGADGGTQVTGINNAGIAVGSATVGGTTEGLIYNVATGTTLEEFSLPGATYGTYVTAINAGAAGTPLAGIDKIAGYWLDASGLAHGFVGIFNPTTDAITFLNENLNYPTSSSTIITGINDYGVVVGYAQNSINGLTNGFEATVIPSPGTLWLAGAALMGMAASRRPKIAA